MAVAMGVAGTGPDATAPDALYRASARAPSIVDVPELRFLLVDGLGSPALPAFAEAVQALYAVSYALRFAVEEASGTVWRVAPLEALWWSDDPGMRPTVAALRRGEGAWSDADRSRWRWTAMIHQPEVVDGELVAEVAPATIARKRLAAVPPLRFEPFTEGLAAQVLHVGPYADEAATIAWLHRFIAEHGYRPAGRHHEIYLRDPRRAAPSKLRTILRQPVAPA